MVRGVVEWAVAVGLGGMDGGDCGGEPGFCGLDMADGRGGGKPGLLPDIWAGRWGGVDILRPNKACCGGDAPVGVGEVDGPGEPGEPGDFGPVVPPVSCALIWATGVGVRGSAHGMSARGVEVPLELGE